LAKKSRRNREKSADRKESSSATNDRWISNRTGLVVMAVLGLVLAAYVIWQLYPSEGSGAILWGLGFAASIWLVFGLAYLFNTFVRGK
jgi:hypothetical protein